MYKYMFRSWGVETPRHLILSDPQSDKASFRVTPNHSDHNRSPLPVGTLPEQELVDK